MMVEPTTSYYQLERKSFCSYTIDVKSICTLAGDSVSVSSNKSLINKLSINSPSDLFNGLCGTFLYDINDTPLIDHC